MSKISKEQRAQWRDTAYIRQDYQTQRLLDALDEAEGLAAANEEMARFHSKNEDFYRKLISEIGETFGVAAYTSDDGSVQDSVLALKVPELVRDLHTRLEVAERERDDLEETLYAERYG